MNKLGCCRDWTTQCECVKGAKLGKHEKILLSGIILRTSSVPAAAGTVGVARGARVGAGRPAAAAPPAPPRAGAARGSAPRPGPPAGPHLHRRATRLRVADGFDPRVLARHSDPRSRATGSMRLRCAAMYRAGWAPADEPPWAQSARGVAALRRRPPLRALRRPLDGVTSSCRAPTGARAGRATRVCTRRRGRLAATTRRRACGGAARRASAAGARRRRYGGSTGSAGRASC